MISTSYAGGMLFITGIDQTENFTIKNIAGRALTLTGNSVTSIDGSPSINTRPATSVKMILRGGDDVDTIDPSSAFSLSGAFNIDGGTIFGGAFTANTGAGDDILDIGLGTGLPVVVATFTGKATI